MQIKAKRSCRSCPFRAPTGRCLDSTRKSGRCGIWVWYFRGNKQCRRRYARPKDPATLAQLLSRGRFGASSRRYGRSLTDKEQAACIAAGAKLRSRSRLNQSGPLTGQQYWVKKDSIHAKLNVKPTKAKTTPQLPQPQRVTRCQPRYTPEHRRSPPRASPSGHWVGAEEWRGKEVCRTQDGPGGAAITSAATSESYAFHAETLPAYYRRQTPAGSSAIPESHRTAASCVAHATGDTEHRCQTPPAIQGSWRSRSAEVIPSGQAAQPHQAQHRLGGLARAGEVHFEFGHPVVVSLRVHQHLLDPPGALAFGGEHVGVAEVAGFRVQADVLVLGVVGVQRCLEAPGSPRLRRRALLRRGEIGDGRS